MFNHIPPITKSIILINIILYLLTQLLEIFDINLSYLLGAFYPQSPNFKLYQIISHMFMHGGFAHVVFNMYGVFLFGSVLENSMNKNHYIILYFLSGLGAFLLFNWINYFSVQKLIIAMDDSKISLGKIGELAKLSYYNSENTLYSIKGQFENSLYNYLKVPMVGASGCVFGLLASFAVLYPNQRLLFLFVPFPIKAKYMVLIYFLIEVYLGFYYSNESNIAHFAHVGGAIVGFIYTKRWKNNRY